MRGAATGLELPKNPHPSRLRRDTLSRGRERGGAAATLGIQKSNRDSFSHLWEKVGHAKRGSDEGAATGLELPESPHPSRLRRDTFSRGREKEGTPSIVSAR